MSKTYVVQFDDGEIRRIAHPDLIRFFQDVEKGLDREYTPEELKECQLGKSYVGISIPGDVIGNVEDWDFVNNEIDVNLHGEYDPQEMLAWMLTEEVPRG